MIFYAAPLRTYLSLLNSRDYLFYKIWKTTYWVAVACKLWNLSFFLRNLMFSLSIIGCSFLFTFRGSCPEVFCKKVFLKNFAKFTSKCLCWSLFLISCRSESCNFIEKGLLQSDFLIVLRNRVSMNVWFWYFLKLLIYNIRLLIGLNFDLSLRLSFFKIDRHWVVSNYCNVDSFRGLNWTKSFNFFQRNVGKSEGKLTSYFFIWSCFFQDISYRNVGKKLFCNSNFLFNEATAS